MGLKVEVEKAVPDEGRKNKMQKEFNGFEKVFKKSSEAAATIEKQVQSIHNKIMDIGKQRVSAQQGKVDAVNKIIDEVNQKKTKATVAIKTAGRNIKKAQESQEMMKEAQLRLEEVNKIIDEVNQKKTKAT